MTNDELLARAEKAEKELAEHRTMMTEQVMTKVSEQALGLVRQRDTSCWFVVRKLVERIIELEAQVKEQKP